MTDQTSAELRAALATNAVALKKATEDAALYDRLKAASSEVRRLKQEGDALLSKMQEAQGREYAAERAAVAARIRNLRITTANAERGPLQASYSVDWEGLAYDSNQHCSVWMPCNVTRLSSLPQDILVHIIRSEPEKLPQCIAELAPGNPEEALDRYFVALRRGYL
ncbi:hypothetical protein [uncultured Sphingomonas sp.]|uniref:hypothetical protein n=1 Tax=uncultured Sphingomonas sp. TaxID=158754 RepID=UPI0025F43AE9|nr:hypothetical protein [uncultured Sphingomonas sp.]